jgi:Mn2+/Fe2+ NRAMP family transporter
VPRGGNSKDFLLDGNSFGVKMRSKILFSFFIAIFANQQIYRLTVVSRSADLGATIG